MTSAQLLLAEDSGLGSSERPSEDGSPVLLGTGVGSRLATGVARVADDPADVLAVLEPGEVIVTRSTNPAWNAVLPLAAALVVEEGGALSHAAIISRELALPAVIGATAATTVIRTGDRVEVDPTAGTVRILEAVRKQG
jgi:pyruvate,water dikinase